MNTVIKEVTTNSKKYNVEIPKTCLTVMKLTLQILSVMIFHIIFLMRL